MSRILRSFIFFWAVCATFSLSCTDTGKTPDNGSGTESAVNGTKINDNTTLYGTVTDTHGTPLKGVAVSDGYTSVATDENGVYQMVRNKKARFVYYSTPGGYAVKTDSDNLPAFYEDISASNIADRHDFVLTPLDKAEKQFTLICIADPQCKTTDNITRYSTETLPDVEATVTSYRNTGIPSYGMTLGDIIYDTPNLWSNMRKSMSNLNLTIFQTIGNHDHLKSETSDFNAIANYENYFGPTNYSFDRGDAHIVSIDNVLYHGSGSGASTNYNGGISDAQLEWLRQDLSHVDRNKLLILCAHIPFRTGNNVTDESHENYDGVLDLLSEFAEAHIMIGHTHYNQQYTHKRNGKTIREHIHGAACGAWWASNMCTDGSPNGYGVYEISGNTITNLYYKSTNKPADYQMRAYPAKKVFGSSGSTTFCWASNNKAVNDDKCIVVNVWKAGGDWDVKLYQDGQQAAQMTLFTTPDYWAYSYHVLHCAKTVGSTWGKSIGHFFYGNLKSGTPETANFEIVAKDYMGNVYRTSSIQTDYIGF